MTRHSQPLDRRTALALGAAAALPVGSLRVAAEAASGATEGKRIDLSGPLDVLRATRRVMFAEHEDVLVWWLQGTKYGVVDNVTTPLYNMEVATILSCHDEKRDRFVVTSLEIVFCTDVATGALLERWRNPYTSEWVDLQNAPVGPTRIPYGVNGPEFPGELPGSKFESTNALGRALIVGDDVWIRADNDVVVTAMDGSGRPPFRVHDWATYHARLADIQNDRLRSPDADVFFMAVTSWPKNFRMENRPGALISRCVGRKVHGLAEVPAACRVLLGKRFPEIYDNPSAALNGATNRFER